MRPFFSPVGISPAARGRIPGRPWPSAGIESGALPGPSRTALPPVAAPFGPCAPFSRCRVHGPCPVSRGLLPVVPDALPVSRGPWCSSVGRGPWAVGRGPWAVGRGCSSSGRDARDARARDARDARARAVVRGPFISLNGRLSPARASRISPRAQALERFFPR